MQSEKKYSSLSKSCRNMSKVVSRGIRHPDADVHDAGGLGGEAGERRRTIRTVSLCKISSLHCFNPFLNSNSQIAVRNVVNIK